MQRTRLLFLCSIWVFVTAVAAEEPFRTAADRPVDIHNIRLDLDVALEAKTVSGTATIDFAPLRPMRVLTLNAVDHEVSSVKWMRDPAIELSFENTGTTLVINFPETLSRDARQQIVISYRVREPKTGLYFFAPSDAEPKVPLMVWSQGEPNGNRYWFPSLDHPNERQTTEIVATVDPGFEVLSNGKLVSREELSGGKKVRFHWQQEEPHVAYLVTLVVGKFAVTKTEWRGKPVTYYVPPERAADAERTFKNTIDMLELFTSKFGIEYPWSKYAQVVVEQFIVGGMENTSATTLTQAIMHDERALLDSSPDRLIAHELGHQWWGDLLTCKDWSHLWLNEGFATYCEVLWEEQKSGRDEADYLLYEKSKTARGASAKARPVVDYRYDEPRNMFDERVYPKGGWILHMLRKRVGDEDFFRGVQQYGMAYKYSTVETADLRQTFERLLGISLERFFYDWTGRAGHPVLTVASSYESDSQLVKIVVKQTQDGEAFHFPLKIELTDANSSAPVIVEKPITEKELTLYVPVFSRPTQVRVDPDYTLLADLKEEKSEDWWKAQVLKAPNVVERIRAVEYFGGSKSGAARELLASILKNDKFYGVQAEAAEALGKSGGDASREALIAGLSHSHPKVRRACAAALGKFEDDEKAIAALEAKRKSGDASYFVEAEVLTALGTASRRPPIDTFLAALETNSHNEVIRVAALQGLGNSFEPHALDVVLDWTARGKPMACRVAAVVATGKFLTRNEVAAARQQEIVEKLLDMARQGGSRVRRAAILALRDLATAAKPGLEVLQSLAAHDPDERVRVAAAEAAKQIAAQSPAQNELGRLRGEIDDLTKRNRELEDRLLKLEAK